jgi:hypothetical protein
MEYSREALIQICKDAVVHHTKWQNRDSYSAQLSIQSIYKGLTAGLEFRVITKEIDKDYHSDEDTIIIEFIQPIDLYKLEKGEDLAINSRDEYHKDCDPDYETEMFDGEGIDFESSYTQTYMPTRKRIIEKQNGDWY